MLALADFDADFFAAFYLVSLRSLWVQIQSSGGNCTAVDMSVCPNGHCLLPALRHFYGRLCGRAALEPLNYPSGLRFTDSDAVKYLITLVGDLHQPLHLGHMEDDCGKLFNVTYGVGPSTSTTSLYEFWEGALIRKIIGERAWFWDSGWTHVNAVRHEHEKERVAFEKEREIRFEAWADENMKIACNSIYTHPISKLALEGAATVDGALERAWFDLIKHRILTAGSRLAVVLNQILEDRNAASLRQGSGVSDVRDEDDHEDVKELVGRQLPNWVRNLLINISIMLLVLGVCIYGTRFYSSTASPSSAFHPGGGGASAGPAPGRGMEMAEKAQ
eukprot:GHVT01094652.1.p1 GENE.GHVT01094652.1~~GHVT01094652.1.p1  ORF type:complete len:332 (+),score=68.55 GHVT01094652.1:178-1173(+)